MLVDRPPLTAPADLIFCRNLLLYFAKPMREKAFARLRAMAAPQSFLVLGAGETVLGQTDQFVASPRLRGLYEPADQQVRRVAACTCNLAGAGASGRRGGAATGNDRHERFHRTKIGRAA